MFQLGTIIWRKLLFFGLAVNHLSRGPPFQLLRIYKRNSEDVILDVPATGNSSRIRDREV